MTQKSMTPFSKLGFETKHGFEKKNVLMFILASLKLLISKSFQTNHLDNLFPMVKHTDSHYLMSFT